MKVMNNMAADPAQHAREQIGATPFTWQSPLDVPRRQWLYGHHLIRRNISVTVAPGGVGKSSLTIVQALELATGRNLLGVGNSGPYRVWLFNLEDERDELNRRILAAMQHHQIKPEEIEGRLFVDTGREQQLILADQSRDGVQVNAPLCDALEAELRNRQIDVLIVDPFVSSHRVNEIDNGQMDIVVKKWISIADRCGCAIELVHHTRKLNGAEASSDSSRGASSLVAAARSARVLQRVPEDDLRAADVAGDGCTYFSVKRDKSNLAPGGRKEMFRTVSVELGQGDTVGVVEAWKQPGVFQGLKVKHLEAVQQALSSGEHRYSDQTGDAWAGVTIAKVLGFELPKDKARIKSLIKAWIASGSLKKEKIRRGGKEVPLLLIGTPVSEV